MKNTLKTPWTKTDDFQFIFINSKKPMNISGGAGGMTVQDVFDIAVMNISLPQMGSDVESTLMGGEWRIQNTKFQPFTFSITFRDFGSLDLRNYFIGVWSEAQRGYFDDVKSHIKVSAQGNVIFESTECLITAVSQVEMDNSNSQIAEFTVEFSTPYFSNWQIKNFGSDAYRNSVSGNLNLGSGGLGGTISKGLNGLGSLQNIVSTVKTWF